MHLSEQKDKLNLLAWGGWSMRVPELWRPLTIEGGVRSGQLMIGDGETAVGQVKWLRPGRRFQPSAWLQSRLRSAKAAEQQVAQTRVPSPEGFDPVAWAPDVEQKRRGRRSFWMGYHEQANLCVEVVVNATVRSRWVRAMTNRVLPSLQADPADGPTLWSIFAAAFETPADYDVTARHLIAGDIALSFEASGKRRLVLRQLYPAELALGRRDMERWMRSFPFKEKRRYTPTGELEDWVVDTDDGRELEGKIRFGRKHWAMPFGRIAPLKSLTGAVHDKTNDRLLLAQWDTKGEQDEDDLADILARMNRPAEWLDDADEQD